MSKEKKGSVWGWVAAAAGVAGAGGVAWRLHSTSKAEADKQKAELARLKLEGERQVQELARERERLAAEARNALAVRPATPAAAQRPPDNAFVKTVNDGVNLAKGILGAFDNAKTFFSGFKL